MWLNKPLTSAENMNGRGSWKINPMSMDANITFILEYWYDFLLDTALKLSPQSSETGV
jgi:hypothetical protein